MNNRPQAGFAGRLAFQRKRQSAPRQSTVSPRGFLSAPSGVTETTCHTAGPCGCGSRFEASADSGWVGEGTCSANSGKRVNSAFAFGARFNCSAFLRASKTKLKAVRSQGRLTCRKECVRFLRRDQWIVQKGPALGGGPLEYEVSGSRSQRDTGNLVCGKFRKCGKLRKFLRRGDQIQIKQHERCGIFDAPVVSIRGSSAAPGGLAQGYCVAIFK